MTHTYRYATITLQGQTVALIEVSDGVHLSQLMKDTLIRRHDPHQEQVLFRKADSKFQGSNALLSLLQAGGDSSRWIWREGTITVTG